MCINGAIFEYENEDQFYEKMNKKFYNKTDDKWDYYSGLPNPRAYE